MILYQGNVMVRNSTLSENALIFDKELRKIDNSFNKDIQTFRLIHSYK